MIATGIFINSIYHINLFSYGHAQSDPVKPMATEYMIFIRRSKSKLIW